MARPLKAAFPLVCFYMTCMRMPTVHMAIYSRSANAANSVVGDVDNSIVTEDMVQPLPSSVVNTDFMDKLSWQCANNASCLYALANGILQAYKRGETVKLGLLDLVKLPPTPTKSKSKYKSIATESGRGISTFVDFISGNAIRIPVGPMVFSVQRADKDGDYIEVALLKKAVTQGRRNGGGDSGGGGLLGGTGGGGGLLGGGGGNGGGGLGSGGGLGGGGGGGRRKQQQDKKQFQMFIPMYLAATTFGWTMVAAKAVGFLTLKALVISKLAFLVAAMVLIKKLMDNASDKMMYQFPEHTPYMMPYGMDYPMHPMGGPEMAPGDMYPAALHLAAGGPLSHQGHPGLESLGSESSLHHNIADVHNNTQVLAALNAVGLGQKVKREDSWVAKRQKTASNFLQDPKRRPLRKFSLKEAPVKFRNGEALVLAAAVAVAENVVREEEQSDEDYIFNEEENVKET